MKCSWDPELSFNREARHFSMNSNGSMDFGLIGSFPGWAGWLGTRSYAGRFVVFGWCGSEGFARW